MGDTQLQSCKQCEQRSGHSLLLSKPTERGCSSHLPGGHEPGPQRQRPSLGRGCWCPSPPAGSHPSPATQDQERAPPLAPHRLLRGPPPIPPPGTRELAPSSGGVLSDFGPGWGRRNDTNARLGSTGKPGVQTRSGKRPPARDVTWGRPPIPGRNLGAAPAPDVTWEPSSPGSNGPPFPGV